MTKVASRLETLILHSWTSEIVLPKQSIGGGAPRLRHLILTGVALSTFQRLLSSATSLISLVLEHIPSSAYFSPDNLVTQIKAMPFLQTLSINFLSMVPRPGFGGGHVYPQGQVARIELPELTQLIYRGVSTYVEALLSRIWSPRIEDLNVTLFGHPTLDVPLTCEFVHELESFQPTRVRIDFAETSVHIAVSAPQSTTSPDVFLNASSAGGYCMSLQGASQPAPLGTTCGSHAQIRINETSMPDIIQTSGLHPFSSSSDKTIAFLHSLLDTTARVAHSVTLHSTTAVNDSRTVSLLREQSTGQHLLHLSRIQVAKTISAAQERRRSDTWYDGPSDDSSTLARISTWSSAVGMQAFPEAAAGTLVLGGKVLVLDVALIPEPTVHASYAGSAEGRDSPTMDAFFSRLVSGVSKGGDGRRLRDALGYLMCLDELAAHEGNGGARWFSEVDVLAKELAKFTQAEAAFLAQCVPSLDPHLPFSTPSVPWSQAKFGYEILRFHILRPPPLTHCYLVVLRFHSLPNAIGFSYDFPLPAGPDAGKYGWVLGFGAGIVISQSRMLEIARAVQPQELSYPGTGPSLSFMTGSWVDTLMVLQLNSEGALSSERYTATYVSPTNMHPPLRLTLTAPDEPGFLLERVQVYNMQEAWAVLEIVREQCWLNEVLNGIAWMPEVVVGPPVGDSLEAEATEEELRALLSGTYTPVSIPEWSSISVVLNGPAGATVEVQGAMGADVQMATLEEAIGFRIALDGNLGNCLG
ncbi:hypothetical protein EDB84DRAFT_1578531 [Lactarius hengduanensis]|nr:hypothetical protein EDB84DRAFT_1578531 [Lactarius hengduanensis]